MNEWQFAGRVCRWIFLVLEINPSLPFAEPDVEEQSEGTRKRNDITLKDKSGVKVLTGEIKLPWAADGQSPYNDEVVADARKKAKRARVRYFFTWNVNDFVLWETEPEGGENAGKSYKSWHVADIHTDTQIELLSTDNTIKLWLRKFLYEFRSILEGSVSLGKKAPDEYFIETIESYLRQPIFQTHDALLNLYKDKRFKREIDRWMQSDLGWVVSDYDEDIRD